MNHRRAEILRAYAFTAIKNLYRLRHNPLCHAYKVEQRILDRSIHAWIKTTGPFPDRYRKMFSLEHRFVELRRTALNKHIELQGDMFSQFPACTPSPQVGFFIHRPLHLVPVDLAGAVLVTPPLSPMGGTFPQKSSGRIASKRG